MILKIERLQEYRRLQVVSYGIDYVARPLLLFFSSENRLLWFSEVQAQIRRIFLDGYGVLVVRTVIFKYLRLSSRMRYPKETMDYYFYYPLENKIFVFRNAELFENSFMVQEASGSHGLLEMSGSDKGLELIQEEDTQPSKNTSKTHNEVAPIEYELGDLNEPPNYKAALADPRSDKLLETMNTKM
ncbi:hypothetical protein Tco_1109741 [Tanacetum coccineum]|uniref:Uncharacterized protein n=1 Tax=Tanacetum coccineum TaxID=301880 RepID=A0ABQ5IIV6_9ASTR